MKNIPQAVRHAEGVWRTVLTNSEQGLWPGPARVALKAEIYEAIWKDAFEKGFVQGALWEQRGAPPTGEDHDR